MPTHIYDLEAEVLSLDATDRAHLLERLIESFASLVKSVGELRLG